MRDFSAEAPTTMLTQQGKRVKTDARDALMIAQCLSYGGYHAVYIPTQEDDSVKEYLRMRDDHKEALKKIKQQINALCLRHGHHYEGTTWTIKHVTWLRKLELPSLYQGRLWMNIWLLSMSRAAKIERFDQRIEELSSQEQYWEKVKKLCCFLGIKTHTALSLIVRVREISCRLAKGSAYAAFLGLAPGEHSPVGKKQTGQVSPRQGTDICASC